MRPVETRVLVVDPDKPDVAAIRYAARILQDGGLVAFPTETVYGLGGDATNPRAAMRIFEAKGRPPDNPLIVHIARREDLWLVARDVPQAAQDLVERFWPGPLTMVLPRTGMVPDAVTAGLDTVAVRMPDHGIALALIAEAGVPVAAPSANTSGKPSPTTADHVIQDLAGRIDLVIDGGPTPVGVESTVIDMTSTPPVILRPGGATREDISEVLGEVMVSPVALGTKMPLSEGVPRSPGMKYTHYSPDAEVRLFEGDPRRVVPRLQAEAKGLIAMGKRVGIMCTDETKGAYQGLSVLVKSAGSRRDLSTVASRVFALLREFDRDGADIILVEGVPETGLGFAIMNRLRKAASITR
ncbi:MAG TPA: threonylcarbamoyl-AMP synthase [Firmicutes bacterium]|nr:threonylcarbamoyl-AMP synthase [Bacillota bacterium]